MSGALPEVVIGGEARAAILDHAREASDGTETGGILLGRETPTSIEVLIAGDAGPNANRRPDSFLRDLEHARRLADEAWRTRRAVWVGEWHTHLNGATEPSAADLATYVKHLSAAELEFTAFVSVIVVPGDDGSWERPDICSWVLQLVR